MEYRKDIDGVRALAVMLVLLHHLRFDWIHGGFVGVDVFFVISGFLISGIIYQKFQQNNFSIRNFYERRIRRLMPALFFTLFASSLAFGFVLLPTDLINFSQSLVWISLHLGNIFFWKYNGGYFAENNLETPLLHTWSLAVEEQYYLVWPLILFLGLRFIPRRWFLLLASLLLIVSVLVSQYGTLVTFGAAYYLLPTRFFELMIGSMIALLWTDIPAMRRIWHHLLSIGGLLLILYASYSLSPQHLFPGFNALIPTLGTAMLILSKDGVVNRLLSFRAVVFVGLISYSLYLVHWPIIAFYNYLSIQMTLPVQLQILAMSLVLGALSWRYVEMPFRSGGSRPKLKNVFVSLYLAPTALVLLLGAVVIGANGFPARFSNDILAMEAAYKSHPEKLRQGCHHPFRDSELNPSEACAFGADGDGVSRAFMFGDSHANHFTGFVDELGKAGMVRVEDYTMDQCPPIFDLPLGSNSIKAKRCNMRNDQARDYIAAGNFDYVILSAAWPKQPYGNIFPGGEQLFDRREIRREFVARLQATIDWITDRGMVPVILRDNPSLDRVSSDCPIKRKLFGSPAECLNLKPANTYMDRIVRELVAQSTELVVIEIRELICDADLCRVEFDGIPLYRDDNHLNDTGARILAQEYLRLHGNPLSTPAGTVPGEDSRDDR